MGRAEYDEAFFLPPAPPEPFDASVDDAKEIGATVVWPTSHSATLCHFDQDEDLVYGEEFPIAEYWDNVAVDNETGDVVIERSMVVQTVNRELKGYTLLYTDFPYSTNTRGRARLWSGSKDSKRYTKARQEVARLLSQGKTLGEVLERYEFDPFRKDDDGRLRAYFFDPLTEGVHVFSNRAASKSDKKKARRLEDQMESPANHIGDLPVKLRWMFEPYAFKLWGICQSYEEARRWLRFHQDIIRLVEATMDGTLFKDFPSPFPGGVPPTVNKTVQDMAEDILEVSIHNVLCGTFDPAKYRGDAPNRRRPGEYRKQTLANHLWHCFYDTALNLHKRRSGKGGFDSPQADVNHIAVTPAIAGAGEAFDDNVARLRALIASQTLSDDAHGILVAALRDSDGRPELLIEATALSVACQLELRTVSAEVPEIIDGLTNHPAQEVRSAAHRALEWIKTETR